ncbi:unnamed protein product, partial [Sphagnum jensenii]
EEEDLNLWYTGAAAMSHKWSEKQNFARRSTSTSTGLCVDDHEPNYCKKQVPGGVVARLMGLDSLPIKKAPGIPHLGETPHTDSEMLHGNLMQSNHCSRFVDEQCKHSSDLQQIRDKGIFSQVSNLQNDKSFTNMKKENETRSMEIIMDQKQQQQEGLSSRVKVDMKWDEASSECNKSELELNDGWGFKLVKSTQRLGYRTRREEKESPLDGPSHQSPKSPLWSSGSNATAAETNKDAVTPIFEKKKLLMDIETKVPSSMSMRLDKREDNAKLLQASAAASVEECGQPSPVSILESPFLDESPTTTSEESISESEHSLDGILEDGCTESTEPSLLSSKQSSPGVVDTRGSDVTTIDIESNRVGQSRLVEIPNFRSNSNNADITLNSSVDEEWEEEMKTYIREILNEGNNNNSNRNLVNKQKLVEGSDRIWQGDQRHQLFDSVNEMMMDVYCDVQYFSCSRSSELHYYFVPSRNTLELTNTGTEKLVIEIYGKIRESCNFATNDWQSLVDRDLMRHGSNRSRFQLNQEIAELGNDIEHMLFKLMIDELIYDLFSVSENQWNPNLHLQQGAHYH